MKNISLLGSTGSIGTQALDIVSAHRNDLCVKALAAGGRNLPLLARQIEEFKPELVAVPTGDNAKALQELLGSNAKGVEIVVGDDGLEAVATHHQIETLVTGVVGFLGLKPTAAAIKRKTDRPR